MNYLNLGCGEHYHRDWINIDLISTGPPVIAHDLSRGIPLPDESCDVVYHSHVLEHIRLPEVGRFMSECFRVLKAGGIIRVAVPDLEQICRLYLEKLDGALAGKCASAQDYQWIMLELFDQTVREHWRSPMWDYLHRQLVPNEAFVRARIGDFQRSQEHPPRRTLTQRARSALRSPAKWLVDRLQFLKPVRALTIGWFRLSGELHQWMYDRYSLAELMKAAGFENPIRQPASQSLIPNWTSYNLDTFSDGRIYKPDSLFMEGVKPASRSATL